MMFLSLFSLAPEPTLFEASCRPSLSFRSGGHRVGEAPWAAEPQRMRQSQKGSCGSSNLEAARTIPVAGVMPAAPDCSMVWRRAAQGGS